MDFVGDAQTTACESRCASQMERAVCSLACACVPSGMGTRKTGAEREEEKERQKPLVEQPSSNVKS